MHDPTRITAIAGCFMCAIYGMMAEGANCVVIEKCSNDTRKKLLILDADPSYKVTSFVHTVHVCGYIYCRLP